MKNPKDMTLNEILAELDENQTARIVAWHLGRTQERQTLEARESELLGQALKPT